MGLIEIPSVHPFDTDCVYSIRPERHIALRTLWDTIAAVLSLYDIEPGLNEDGKLIIPWEFTGGLVRSVSILQYFVSQSSAVCLHVIIEGEFNHLTLQAVTSHFELGSDCALSQGAKAFQVYH